MDRTAPGLERSLGRCPELGVVATCGGVEDALALAAAHQPDVVLLDYQLDGERNERFLSEASRNRPCYTAFWRA